MRRLLASLTTCVLAASLCTALFACGGGDTSSCEHTVDAYLASTPTAALDCPSTWRAAQEPTSWGSGCYAVTISTCGSLRLAVQSDIDTGTRCYYDGATGALVRIEDWAVHGTTDSTCVAGSGDSPSCSESGATKLCP